MPKNCSSQSNPRWTRDELILALDVYFRFPPPHSGGEAAKAIEEVSQLLRQLPIHAERPDQERFRNVNGVRMKLANLQYQDPDHPGGSPNGGKLDGEVFRELQNDRARLHALAASIRANAPSFPELKVLEEDFDEIAAPEGRVLLRLHKQRERNRQLVKQRKAKALEKEGCLKCQVCGFDFHEQYGELGEGFIECHHTKPISELKTGDVTKLSDLALVCANCHRMLHRGGDVISPQELKMVLEKPLGS